MSGRASEIWQKLTGASARTAPKPLLIGDDGEEETLVSVAEVNVGQSGSHRAAAESRPPASGDRLRRSGLSQTQPDTADPEPLVDWTMGDSDGAEAITDTSAAPAQSALIDIDPVDIPSAAPDNASPLPAPEVPADASAAHAHTPVEAAAAAKASASSADARRPIVELPAAPLEDPLPYRLRVLSGMHEGAELELDAGAITIGGLTADDGPADLTLADLSGTHQIIFEAGHVFGPESHSAPLELPCEIEIDGIRLSLESTAPFDDEQSFDEDAPQTSRRQRSGSSAAGPVGATVAGLALSLAILGATIPLVSDPEHPAPITAAQSVPDIELSAISDQIAAIAPGIQVKRQGEGVAFTGAVSEAASPALKSAAAAIDARLPVDLTGVATAPVAADALRRRIASGGLGDSLRVEQLGDVLIVSGAMTEDQAQFWDDLETWFTSKYAPTIALDNRITRRGSEMASAPRIGLQAVWVGQDPYLIAADGRRSRPGDKLPGGWRILDISPERVRLSREGSVHDIQLAAAPASPPVQAELRQSEASQ